MKKKHVDEIRFLEEEKLTIQHQPIFEELTKLKQLNMTGETEKKFERWRQEWTEVVDIDMPTIDSLLFDAEESLRRFQFKKVQFIENEIRQLLDVGDEKKDRILQELDELIGSEEKNRVEIEKLSEEYRAARKTILTRQFDYGEAFGPIEQMVEQLMPKFEQYEEETANGNYLTAREIVLQLSREGEKVFHYIQTIPILYEQLKTNLPSVVRELRNGLHEMEHTGHDISYLEIPEQLDQIEEEIQYLKDDLATLNTVHVDQQIVAIEDQFDLMYTALEKEVYARHKVEQTETALQERILNAMFRAKEAKDEARYVQESYRLDEKEADIPRQLEKRLESLYSRHDQLQKQLQRPYIAYTLVEEELFDIIASCERMEEELDRFSDRMEKLRIDEMNARKTLEQLEQKHRDAERRLLRANIPGIPDDVSARLEEADEKLYLVEQSLQEKPLNIVVIESYTEDAKNIVRITTERVERLLLDVEIFEQAIQYGNRYRRSEPSLDEAFIEAEDLFRQYRYDKALEVTALALEEIEPGAMDKIEQFMQS